MSGNICNYCGNLRFTNRGMCEDCAGDYTKIRSFIESKPMATIMEIIQETNITYKKIKLFIDNGQFSIRDK